MPNIPQNNRYASGMQYIKPQNKAAYNPSRNNNPTAPKPAQSPQFRNPTVEHIKPLNPQKSRARVSAANAKNTKNTKNTRSVPVQKKKRAINKWTYRDFLLGFFVGLVIFGIAAIIICTVLIGMLA